MVLVFYVEWLMKLGTIYFSNALFAHAVWKSVLSRLRLYQQCSNWAGVAVEATERFKGERMMAKVGGIAFTASVCCIRQEGN